MHDARVLDDDLDRSKTDAADCAGDSPQDLVARIGLCLNVSPKQLRSPELIGDVAAALEQAGLPPSTLCIEITESVLMNDAEFFLGALLGLKLLGVQIAIDDFGTGYSSLGYIRELPLDGVKLDRIFTRDLTVSAGAWALARAIVTMIGQLGHYLKPDEQFRIALARVYLHDPSILIVEEPSTPIDNDTRHFIEDTMARLSNGRTLIVIPHRLSSIRASDHVIVLHNGHVEETGTPMHLQNESKLFRHLIYGEYNEYVTGEAEGAQMDHTEGLRKTAVG